MVTVNDSTVTAKSVSGDTVRAVIPTPAPSIPNDGAVTVVINSGITNPTTAGSNKTLVVQTNEDPDPSTSNRYTIISSSTQVTSATVTVNPSSVSDTASYSIVFSLGSNGAMLVGDTLTVIFPADTDVPSSIATTSIQVNATSLSASPVVQAANNANDSPST